MAKSSFFGGTGISATNSTALESSTAAAAASAASAATSASSTSSDVTASAASATASEVSRQASLVAKNAAVVAKSAAETAETNAETAQAASANSATANANSATASANSATASAASATASANSATASEASKVTSTTKASEASTSASTASTKAADAETARAASVVAKDASVVAKNESVAAKVLSVAAKDASVVAKNAAVTAQNNSSASAQTATTKASEASTSAGTATTKASQAATSATASESSKVASVAAKDAALAALDSFDDRYLGSKSGSAPTVDNDGDSLASGMLYFDTDTDAMKVYDGSQWLNAYASLSGALLTTSNLSDLSNAGTARTNLGLGTAATTAASAYATAAQGSKVDGIEASATADQTNAEIRAAVEAASDSNVFTDSDHTKLNGIASGATNVTNNNQLTNGAGYVTTDTNTTYSVGDGGLTQNNFTNADHTKLNAIATGATNVTNNNQLTNGAGYVTTDTNTTYTVGDGGLTQINFTSADHTKLNGIEASATADQTAAQILTAIKTVDGSGSGLDADLLDGKHASDFVEHMDGTRTNAANLNSYLTSGFYNVGAATIANKPSGASDYAQLIVAKGIDTGLQIYGGFSNPTLYVRGWASSGTFYGWRKLWNDSNDGSGSGLDADTVDGIQGASLLRSDAADNFTSLTGTTLTASSHIAVANNDNGFGFWNGTNTYAIKMGSNQANHGTVTDYSIHHMMSNTSTRGFTFGPSRTAVTCSINAQTGAILSSGNITAFSDIRVKDNIEVIPNALDKVSQLSGYTFTRTDVEDKEQKYTGVIAQEVLKVLPEAVQLGATDEDIISVAYGNMVGLLIESIKELKAEVDDLKTQLETK